MEYTQANVDKKEMMANKMKGYKQNGPKNPANTSYTMDTHGDGGMKFKGHGGSSSEGSGMKPRQNGKGIGSLNMKYKQSNPKPTFSTNFYSQNGKKK